MSARQTIAWHGQRHNAAHPTALLPGAGAQSCAGTRIGFRRVFRLGKLSLYNAAMRRRRVAKQTPGRVALPLVLLAAAGCHSAATQRQRLDSSYPPDQIAAAVWLADARDAEAVPRLVRLLEDRDRTVRMYAILALERLSGQTYGYKYYAPEPQRREAVRHWQQALRRGELAVGQVPPESQAEPTSAAPPHQPKGGPGRAAWPAGEEKRVP